MSDTLVKRGFKRKTIIETIEKKMEEWIQTLPPEIQYDVREDYIVTGGAIVSMLQGDLPNDYDVYFRNPVTLDVVRKLYTAGYNPPAQRGFFRVSIKRFIETRVSIKHEALMVTDNAISLPGDIQIITRFCGSPAIIHENFDFIHTTNWYTHREGLHLNPKALEAILAKELRYQGSLYPLCAMFRMRKFIKRGWSITAGEMFKIGYDISKLDLNDIKVLKDQLVGVDALYFVWALKEIEAKGDCDRTYLFEIMNKAFDDPDLDIKHGGGMT